MLAYLWPQIRLRLQVPLAVAAYLTPLTRRTTRLAAVPVGPLLSAQVVPAMPAVAHAVLGTLGLVQLMEIKQ